MRSKLQQYYEDLGATGTISARTVGYRSERSWRAIQAALRRLMPADLTGARVLDVGCGHGAMVREWAERNQLSGVDLATSLLRIARANGLAAAQADALHLPFAGDTFDVVLAIEVLPHVGDADRFLESLVRVTQTGGTIIIGTPNGQSIIRRLSHSLVDLKLIPRAAPEHIPLPVLRDHTELLASAARFPLALEGAASTYYPLVIALSHSAVGRARSLLASNLLLRFRKTSD